MSRTKCKTVWKYNNNLTLEHFQTEFISSITLQDAEVAAASGCHQNCLEAMSCVKTIEVIFEGKSMLQNILCFVTKNPMSFCQTNLKLQEIKF